MNYEMIKKNYDRGLWNDKQVAIAVKAGAITMVQYKEITGQDYAIHN